MGHPTIWRGTCTHTSWFRLISRFPPFYWCWSGLAWHWVLSTPLYILDILQACDIVLLLGEDVVWIFFHLCCQGDIGTHQIFHRQPVLHIFLCKICEGFLYPEQVVGNIASLEHCLLALSEVVLVLDELWLGVLQFFVALLRALHVRQLSWYWPISPTRL